MGIGFCPSCFLIFLVASHGSFYGFNNCISLNKIVSLVAGIGGTLMRPVIICLVLVLFYSPAPICFQDVCLQVEG